MFSQLPKRPTLRPESPTLDFGLLAGRMPGGLADSHIIHEPKRFHTEDGPMFDPFKTRNFGCTQPFNAPFWVLLIGETYASAVHAQTHRRPHPGILPDVDFSRMASQAGQVERPAPALAPEQGGRPDSPDMPGSMCPLAA